MVSWRNPWSPTTMEMSALHGNTSHEDYNAVIERKHNSTVTVRTQYYRKTHLVKAERRCFVKIEDSCYLRLVFGVNDHWADRHVLWPRERKILCFRRILCRWTRVSHRSGCYMAYSPRCDMVGRTRTHRLPARKDLWRRLLQMKRRNVSFFHLLYFSKPNCCELHESFQISICCGYKPWAVEHEHLSVLQNGLEYLVNLNQRECPSPGSLAYRRRRNLSEMVLKLVSKISKPRHGDPYRQFIEGTNTTCAVGNSIK